jgi:hypothetical protein
MVRIIILLIWSGNLFAGKFFEAKERVLFDDFMPSYQEKWANLGKSKDENIKILVESLSKSETGKKILVLSEKKAKEFGQTLFDIIEIGDKSLTDTTLIRKFSESEDHLVVIESRSKIYIDKNLGLKEAILDLAHELTHYSLRAPFNPYSPDFSAREFVVSTVEGKGGEVEAFMVECTVFRELFPKNEFLRSNCFRIFEPDTGKILKKKGVQEFYRVGEFFPDFKKEMENHGLTLDDFPSLSKEKVIFYSSTYGLPYPIAALREFESVQRKVCQNNKNRIDLIKGNNFKLSANLKRDFESQCQKFSPTTFVDLN